MKLKQATLFAMLGSIIGLMANLFILISTAIAVEDGLDVSYYMVNLPMIIMEVSFVVFFATLYKNQK